MTGVPGVDRPATAAQVWDETAEAKGRPTVAQLDADNATVMSEAEWLGLPAPEDGITRAKAWADERRAAARPPRTDRDVALDFIGGLCSLHLPPDARSDRTDETGRHIRIDVPAVEVP